VSEVPGPVRPRPFVDRDSALWWAALARHELVVPRCAACGTWRWPPRAICGRCGSLDWSLVAALGRGTVASWVVNRHGFGGAFPLPSTVVLVRLTEQDDLLLPGGWSGAADGSDVTIDLPVVAGFEDVDADAEGDAVTLLTWRAGE
jgi:uncharacterized OB-fold protein